MNLTRLDRVITLGIVQPLLATLRHTSSTVRSYLSGSIPILMYHSISDAVDSDGTPYYRTVTTPARFAEQMRFLSCNGWRGVCLREGIEEIKKTVPSKTREKLVVLTFDDGFRDFYCNAVPVLEAFSFNATMYLPTGLIVQDGLRCGFNGSDCLTWSEVRELYSAGVEFGSHTVSHPKLIELPWAEVESEILHSKDEIEQQLGSRVRSFAYPYAFPSHDRGFAQNLCESLSAAGYDNCVTTVVGRSLRTEAPFFLKRLPVNDSDDPALLTAKLDGAYDWFGGVQRTVKVCKAHALSTFFFHERAEGRSDVKGS
jgi:peptidoglycan/xylan/chitin deacetylase (PgdA/CDA1 family)